MRFVILHHTGWPGQADHYDLLLQARESDDDNERVLLAFSTQDDLVPLGKEPLPLARKNNHRKLYLDYQGVVADGRGHVVRVDEGRLLHWSEFDENNEQPWAFELQGHSLKGHFSLRRSGGNVYQFEKKAGT